ncbi:MAG: S8 family serine peptidase [Blastocatellia bacterium]|nr:S8 family serine peptidase [Blastocatellia bacterium]
MKRALVSEEESIPEFIPQVVVKFRGSKELPYSDAAERSFGRRDSMMWSRLAKQFRGITLKRLFTSLGPDELKQLEPAANLLQDMEWRAPELLSFYAIECPPETKPAVLLGALREWEAVESAYEGGAPAPPPSGPVLDDPQYRQQRYLRPAPEGIDVEPLWRAGGTGAGMRLVDLEQNWGLSHRDLPASIGRLPGAFRYDASHGTSVLGILVAADNREFCLGIAPGAAASVISEYRTVQSAQPNPADAITVALRNTLRFGDILLLETQYHRQSDRSLWPSETDLAVRRVIETAVRRGIVVIEAAGNGGNDLDAFIEPGGARPLNLAGGDPGNSGAILVGAASAAVPHTRLLSSNYGQRVNCYGWGESVFTLAAGPPWFTPNFNGTSSAAAIVAGAAAAVQSLAKKRFGRCYSPLALRALLTGSGTASANPETDRIGVMPDLSRVAKNLPPPEA